MGPQGIDQPMRREPDSLIVKVQQTLVSLALVALPAFLSRDNQNLPDRALKNILPMSMRESRRQPATIIRFSGNPYGGGSVHPITSPEIARIKPVSLDQPWSGPSVNGRQAWLACFA
jgi:hypothetical protein